MCHKLKRTVAVTCLLATACFVILWMRSLNHRDTLVYRHSPDSVSIVDSSEAGLTLRYNYDSGPPGDATLYWESQKRHDIHWLRSFSLPVVFSDQSFYGVFIPYCIPIAIAGPVGIALLMTRPIRFSLRTLAIAATLIVLTLGLGVAASRLTLN